MRMLTRLISALFALVLLAPGGIRAAEPPFEITIVDSTTGAGAFMGGVLANAFGVVESQINSHGGLNGRPVHFAVLDDHTNPQTTVQLVSDAIAKRAQLVITGEVVATCNAPMGLLRPEGPVLYCFSPGVHPPAGSFAYSASFSTLDQMPGAMHFMRLRGWTRIGVLTTTDATGQEADSTLDRTLALAENRGIQVVGHEHFSPGDLSINAQLARLREAKPQALVIWTSGTPFGTALRGLRDAGIDLPVMTTGGNLSYDQMKSYADIMPHELYLMGIPATDSSTVKDRAVAAHIAEFQSAMRGAGLFPDTGAAMAWDIGHVVVDAYRRAGTNASAAQLRDSINSSKYVGVYGRYDFHASPQRGILSYWLLVDRWDPLAQRFVAVTKPGDLFPLGPR